jgi:hypothetical protein
MLSRFSSNPGPEHYTALEWLWGYIKWSLNYELVYNGDNGDLTAYSGAAPKADMSTISGYSDTDWAGCLDTRKSTGGYFILYGNCVIAWKSKLQGNVTRSSTEAEYVQLSITACEMVTFRRLVAKWLEGAVTIKIKPNTQSILTLYGDNQGSLAMALNIENRARTRHIEVHHHYVRDKVEDGTIQLDYLNTKDMLADMLTKPLQKAEHARFSALLGLRRRQH